MHCYVNYWFDLWLISFLRFKLLILDTHCLDTLNLHEQGFVDSGYISKPKGVREQKDLENILLT